MPGGINFLVTLAGSGNPIDQVLSSKHKETQNFYQEIENSKKNSIGKSIGVQAFHVYGYNTKLIENNFEQECLSVEGPPPAYQ